MSSHQLIDHRTEHDTRKPDAATEEHHGLPPILHARVMVLGPRHAPVLSELLAAHPAFSTKILAIASPRMGLQAVQQAIETVNQGSGGTAIAPAAAAPGVEPQTGGAPTAAPDQPAVESAAAPTAEDDHAADAESQAPATSAGPGSTQDGGANARRTRTAPSLLVVATARTYNRAHRQYVEAFNAATNSCCMGPDGQLDPVAVWHWQNQHGISHDGRVGPETTATATAAARRERASAVKEPAGAVAGEQIDASGTAQLPVATPHVDRGVKPQPDDVASRPVPAVKAPVVDDLPAERTPSVKASPVDDIPAERMPSAKAPPPTAVTAQPVTPAPAPGPDATAQRDSATAAQQVAAGGPGSEPTPTVAPAPPARPDNGGPGSLARRVLAAHRTADEAFQYLVSNDDAVLDRNLADYGSVAEQRALLDAVILAGTDVGHVRRAFHAYWHVALIGLPATPKQAAVDWPVASLQAIHHQLRLLPDHDARAGAWKSLSWTKAQGGASRGWWDKGDFSIGTDAWNKTDIQRSNGYFENLVEPAKAGATKLHVRGGERFKVGDQVAIDHAKPNHETSTVQAAEGDTYSLGTALTHDHGQNAIVELAQGGGLRQMSWLDYTVRHEIAHSLDGGAINTRGFYALGGWGGKQFSDWAGAMGEDAWKTNDNTLITEAEDRTSISAGLQSALTAGKSPFDMLRGMDPPHPIMKYEHKEVPVIVAALRAMRLGDSFYDSPTQLYAANGKRFSYSPMYHQLQYFSETAVTERVSNYSLAAPAEFFAEAYATFYEEAGKPGVTDADYGRLIRNADQRQWLHDNVHNRGHGPAGTGAAKTPEKAPADGHEHGARPDGAKRGRSSGNSGL